MVIEKSESVMLRWKLLMLVFTIGVDELYQEPFSFIFKDMNRESS
jgi:hypothetical protein